ncbi:MAG: DNA-formamidopyrimidine glycosylase [Candidatus Nealsonbacteria bacterium CG01_land_8_20_14_3_00_12]|uniref:DNA-formamidopyrimidine glycosylase n=1 Tax=Candidatus Nealsonbacteria bacterium CG01_land_8_20_14_3_00_12 TaxID=1974697 RepID=A0A2M7EBD3_9BACT|nr:MAG: DNA-formamidopyrimidine glycosylase [Candidatus Nealsonbacteria bacterium CG01_land_8_20_14_3_00_12]
MPELPEVETIVRDFKKKVLKRTFLNIWTDFPKMIKLPRSFEQFKKEIKGKKIQKVWRRGKNILFDLSENKTLLIHQKLTGHLLLGKWELGKGEWQAKIPGPLSEDPMNRFLHLIFWLDSGQMLALSDLRKFAKVELGEREEIVKELEKLGPEPLERSFTFEKFKGVLAKQRGKIKQVLMDQTVIAGIGNIYSDEILWMAKVHPFKEIKRLSDEEIKKIYEAMGKILPKAIELGGESISDFRRISGEKGYFDKERKVYRREGEKCSRCGTIIKKAKLAGRSAHFCPRCQK